MTRWVAAGAALLLACAPGGARAQAPEVRAELQRLRLALNDASDSATVLALLERAPVATRPETGRFRQALATLRLADLSRSNARYLQARTLIDSLAEGHDDWVWIDYGVARAELGIAETRSRLVDDILDQLAQPPSTRAVKALVNSVRLDRTFRAALVDIATIALRTHSEYAAKVALEAFRAIATMPEYSRPGEEPGLQRLRAELELSLGTISLAVEAADVYAAARPDDPYASYLVGRSRFSFGRLDGLEAWFDGLRRADPTTLARYRRDLRPLLRDSTLRAFDAARTADERVAIVKSFFVDQDPDRLPATPDRLRDHYVRLDVARREYSVDGQWFDAPTMRPDSAEFDDRGVTVIRHGLPRERVHEPLVGVLPNETWMYHLRDGRDLVFHFIRPEGETRYRAVESIFDIFMRSKQFQQFADHGGRAGTADTLARTVQTYGAELSAQVVQQLMLSRWNVNPIYREILGQGMNKTDSLQARERAIGHASAAVISSWALGFELPLRAGVQMLSIGRSDGRPMLRVAFAARGGDLLARRTEQGVLYLVRVRVAVVGKGGDVVATLDTTRTFRTAVMLAPDQRLLGQVALPVPPGEWSVRVGVEGEGSGMRTSRADVRVPAATPTALALSDLAIGSRAVPLAWVSAGDSTWLNPTLAFPRAHAMELSYEVGGLARGSRYRSEIAVFRLSGDTVVSRRSTDVVAAGGTAAMRFAFDGTLGGEGGIETVRREIALNKLKPGEYVLEVVVTTPEGERAIRRQAFVVTK